MKRNIVLAITVVFLCGLVFLIGSDIADTGISVLSVLGIVIVAFFAFTVVGALISHDQQDVKRLLADENGPPRRPFWDDRDRI